MKAHAKFVATWVAIGLAIVALGLALDVATAPARGAEVTATPQTQSQSIPRASSTWRSVDQGQVAPPRVALVPPPVPPPTPAEDFATPPTDGPDVPATTPPVPAPAPPVVPTPQPPPAPTPDPGPTVAVTPGKSRIVKETEGGILIDQHSPGVVMIGCSGIPQPAAPTVPAAAPQADLIPTAPVMIAVASNPQVQSLALATARRLGGGLYYVATGKCPGAQASTPAATPAAFMMMAAPQPQPQPTYAAAMLPVAPPTYYALQAAPVAARAPAFALAPAPVASPQMMAVSPAPSGKKCWLFGGR